MFYTGGFSMVWPFMHGIAYSLCDNRVLSMFCGTYHLRIITKRFKVSTLSEHINVLIPDYAVFTVPD